MLKVERFVNELMSSNCYIVMDEALEHCICIDPASEKSSREIDFIETNGLTLDYIILTHEHTDHTWGVNSLVGQYPKVKVICSEVCKQNLKNEFQAYFLLYYDDASYHYTVCKVDNTTEELNGALMWQGYEIKFIPTPGHSFGSICLLIDGVLFTGDAIMQTKPYVNKRNGSIELFHESRQKVVDTFKPETTVYPGHGEPFALSEYQIYHIQ